MQTDILAQDSTMEEVGGRAVGAEGGGEVRVVRKRTSREARAGVSEGNTGAVCTLELGVRKAGGAGLH